ncbi:hypothetical protein NMY22_g2061 [Coprinellus aureogranulatus]|nr:hypothetical protein NMY22_g2061 [Coprinellus aureogranulatus]
MILWALGFLLLYSALSSGAPIDAAPLSDKGEPASSPTFRSTFQIVWTCLTIVFASTWVCIHPHIYGYDSTSRQRIGRRIRHFCNALLFPDHLVQRAFEQWLGCRMLFEDMQKLANDLGIPLELASGKSLWTPVHAHFVQMGGVVFKNSYDSAKSCDPSSESLPTVEVDTSDTRSCISEKTVDLGNSLLRRKWRSETGQEPPGSTSTETETTTLKLPTTGGIDTANTIDIISYKDFRQWDEIDIRSFFELRLTDEQIEDRSKADGLAKAFVIIQSLWFVIQCIGRTVTGLPVLELEITCLAFIACNIGMYCFWWKKPMNIVCPVEVHRRHSVDEELSDAAVGPTEETTLNVNWISGWVNAVLYTVQSGDVGYLAHQQSDTCSEFKQIESASTLYPVNCLYSRTGHTNEEELYKEWGAWTYAAYSIAPAIFGALHSVGWYTSFPSPTEQILWRVSCVIPVVNALLFTSFVLSAWLAESASRPRIVRGICEIVSTGSFLANFFISTPVNLAARFVFIVLPLLQLRNLPPLSHQTSTAADSVKAAVNIRHQALGAIRLCHTLTASMDKALIITATPSQHSYADRNPREASTFLSGDRSTTAIVWTCLTVIFTSTWVCIHPNVPGYKTTRLERLALRARFFLNALLFPDNFVKLAFEQWMGCRRLYARMMERAGEWPAQILRADRRPGWTHVHAHFIQMGGIVFRDRSDSSYRMWYEAFDDWNDDDIRKFHELELSEGQIEDKSKADGLAKAFVVIQCLWFVIQCIGRVAYGLPVTELEVTCLAFIACNFSMYGFWWNKPLDVACPIPIDRPVSKSLECTKHENNGFHYWPHSLMSTLMTGDIGHLTDSRHASEGDFARIVNSSPRFPANYFYLGKDTDTYAYLYKKWGPRIWLVYAIAPATFGALHSLAWYSAFPSATEALIWRISCIVPLVHGLLFMASLHLSSVSSGFAGIISFAFRFILVPMNVAARCVFIVLPFLQLRVLPPLSHRDVPWSNFLPHV